MINNPIETGGQKNDSYWRTKHANLEIQLEVRDKRILIAEQKIDALESVEAMLKTQLAKTEEMYLQSKEDFIRNQEEHLAVQTQYEGGCSREEYQKLLEVSKTFDTRLSKIQAELENGIFKI
jgi:hypothetical protein